MYPPRKLEEGQMIVAGSQVRDNRRDQSNNSDNSNHNLAKYV
jgi:hypothetical protein